MNLLPVFILLFGPLALLGAIKFGPELIERLSIARKLRYLRRSKKRLEEIARTSVVHADQALDILHYLEREEARLIERRKAL